MIYRKNYLFGILLLIMSQMSFGMEYFPNSKKEKIQVEISRLADECWSNRMSQTDSSITWGKRALALSKQYGLNKDLPRLNNYLGAIYLHISGNIDTARSYLHDALEISIELKDSVEIAYSYVNLGDIYILTENFPVALFYTEKGLEHFINKNDINGMAYGYEDLGTIYAGDRKFKKSIDYLRKANELRRIQKNKIHEAFNIEYIGHAFLELGEIDTAMKYFEDSYEMQKKYLPETFSTGCIYGMALVYEAKGEYDKAIENFNKIINYNELKFKPWRLVDTHLKYALILAKLGKVKEGEIQLQKGLEIARHTKLFPQILKAKKTYSNFYATINDYDKANEYYQQFESFYDTVFVIRQNESFYEIESNFKYRENIAEIGLQLNKDRILMISLSFTVLIIVLIASFIWWRLREKHEINQKLLAINQTKDKLFSVISHDLRSPFHTLLGFSELISLELKEGSYENVLKYSDIINKKSKESLTHIDNLLNWSRSQMGKLSFRPESAKIDKIFKEIDSLFKADSQKNKLELSFHSSVDRPVLIDIDIIRIILTNLISNALKFTNQNGKIEVYASLEDSSLVLEVKDNGIGMPEKLIESLFNAVATNHSRLGVRNETGFGIRLTLVHELVHLHNGQISVSSKEGVGSNFKVTVPV